MPSEVQHLFSSAGRWVAFRLGKYVFTRSGEWIGSLPWGDEDIVEVHGEYLGTICGGNRLYRFRNHSYRGYPGYPGYPGFASYSPVPFGARVVDISEVEWSCHSAHSLLHLRRANCRVHIRSCIVRVKLRTPFSSRIRPSDRLAKPREPRDRLRTGPVEGRARVRSSRP